MGGGRRESGHIVAPCSEEEEGSLAGKRAASVPRPPRPGSPRTLRPPRWPRAGRRRDAGDARGDCGRRPGLSPRRYVTPHPQGQSSSPRHRGAGSGRPWSPASSSAPSPARPRQHAARVRGPGPRCGRGGRRERTQQVRDGGGQARQRRGGRAGCLRLRLPPGLATTHLAGTVATW